ncbi:MAG: tetratricopeptide repeat protein [Planctomycetota bacterium]|jgi:Flp pilus assembly protein TadD
MPSINQIEKLRFDKLTPIGNKVSFPYISPLVIVFLTVLVYSNALWNEFVFDDALHIIKNEFIQKPEYIPGYFTSDFWKMANFLEKPPYYRPIFLLSFFVDYQLWGLNPFGFHLTNIFFHIATTLFVYLIAINLFRDRLIAFISSLSFGLHPVHTEAVTFIGARTHLLSALFSFMAVWCFLKSKADKGFYYYASILSFVLALFSNEVAVVLPLILILIEYCFYRESYGETSSFILRTFKLAYPIIPYIIVLIACLSLRSYVIGTVIKPEMTMIDLYHRTLTAIWIMAKYIQLLLIPVNLNPYYPTILFDRLFDPAVLLSMVFLFFIVIALIKTRKEYKEIFFSMMWILIPIIPTLGVLYFQVFHRVDYVMMAERYLYIPSAGFCFLTGFLIKKALNIEPFKSNMYSRVMVYAITGIIFVLFSIGTIYQNTIWKNDYILYSKTIQFLRSLGDKYIEKDSPDKAIIAYKEALKFNRYNPEIHDRLGMVYSKMGLFDKAVIEHKKAQKFSGNLAKTRHTHKIDQYDERLLKTALSKYIKSISLGHEGLSLAIARDRLGVSYFKEGMFEEAVQEFKRAIEIYPDYVGAYNNLAVAYIKLGMIDQAISEFKEAARLKPDAVEPHYNLGLLYQEKGIISLAIEEHKKALLLRPDFDLSKKKLKELEGK